MPLDAIVRCSRADRSILTSTHPTDGDAPGSQSPLRTTSRAWRALQRSCASHPLVRTNAPAGTSDLDQSHRQARWKASRLQSNQAFNEVTCASPLFCLASAYGQVFASSYPTAGAAAWTSTFADPRLGPLGSCASQSLCVGIDPRETASSAPGRHRQPARQSKPCSPADQTPARRRTIQALLRHRRYTLTFRTLLQARSRSHGRRPTRPRSQARALSVVIATGAAVLLRPGMRRIPLKLTAPGRQLIKHLGVIKIIANASSLDPTAPRCGIERVHAPALDLARSCARRDRGPPPTKHREATKAGPSQDPLRAPPHRHTRDGGGGRDIEARAKTAQSWRGRPSREAARSARCPTPTPEQVS